MKLSKEQLEELTGLSEIQLTPAECATVLQVPRSDLEMEIGSGEGVVWEAYERGRLMAVAEVRRAILTQAKNGSSPAQKQIAEIMDRTTEVIRVIRIKSS